MENISKITIDDSSASMYFSFNSTAAYKTTTNDNSSMAIEGGDEECDQNNTLEADESNQPVVEQIHTIKKLTFGASPAKAIPKNILKAYKALSSTPTKAQLLRSVEVNRGSSTTTVDVGDLGLAFLEAPQESINAVLSEDKENQPQESLEIIYSETSSEIVVSVIEKTPDDQKPVKRVGFSNLPVLKSSGNSISNIRGGTPKVRRSIPRHEPDLATNRPSRIASTKRMSTARNNPTIIESNSDEIPKMLNSILKISKGLPMNRKSMANMDNPFNLLGKATRMSIVKTTLNSPARKVSRKSLTTVTQVGKIPNRFSNLPMNKGKSTTASSTGASAPRRSVIPTNYRKSILPSTSTSPKKRIASSMNSRKSMIHPTTSAWISNPRKSMAMAPKSDPTKDKTTMKPPSLKEDFVCEFCSRKFLVLSMFEAHKRTHYKASSSGSLTKQQTFSSTVDNMCRYCDKKFAIAKALDNHLIQNCTKIPPGDRKKLLFPTDQPIAATTTAQQSSKSKLPPKSMSNLSSCDSLSSNSTQISRNQSNAKNSADINMTMAPPLSNSKLKKKLAHSGVYCTPNKQIMCHICKMSFNNILSFTEHKLSHSHSNAVTGGGDCAIETVLITTQESDGKLEQQDKIVDGAECVDDPLK